MYNIVMISQISAALVQWLMGALRNWQPTIVVQDSPSSSLVEALLYVLWGCGYPIIKTEEISGLDKLKDSGIHVEPPLLSIPVIVDVADNQWMDVLTKRCKVWGKTPEEVPEPSSVGVRVAVVSASLWREEMRSWDVVFVILVDVDDLKDVPLCDRAIYVTFPAITPHLIERMASLSSPWVGKVIAHPPILLPFSELKGKPYTSLPLRHSVGAVLDSDVISQSDISLWSKKLDALGIDIVSWDDAANYRAILLPVNPLVEFLPTLRKVLDLAGQCVYVFTNRWDWALFYPFVYSTMGWGEPLSMCLQACEQFVAQQLGFASSITKGEEIVKEWLAFVGNATVEGFVFHVLDEAYKLARSIWGAGMLPCSTIWG